MSHANARLALHGRRLPVARVIDDHRPVSHVAKELGVSRQCAHRYGAGQGRVLPPAGVDGERVECCDRPRIRAGHLL